MGENPAVVDGIPSAPRAPWGALPPGAGVDALYVHVPFCFHKCHYCDFYSLVDEHDRQEPFAKRLIAELRWRSSQNPLKPSTIFVGGGTPTLMRAELWTRFLQALREVGALDAVVEFTVEANPETVTPELLDTLVAGGVNRMSVGAQSFQKPLLATLERWHEPANVGRAFVWARAAGIANLSLDLIFGIPGQTLADLDADLDAALELAPNHVSAYGLTYEPKTAMYTRLHRGEFEPMDEDLEAAMFERVRERLEAAGFEGYEISNYAQPGRPSEHNLHYWRNHHWLALGPAGASHVAGLRWRNAPALGPYLASPADGPPPIVDVERLPPAATLGEVFMLGLRLREGLDWQTLDAAMPPDDPRRAALAQHAAAGWVERVEGRLRLTRAGVLLANTVIESLI